MHSAFGSISLPTRHTRVVSQSKSSTEKTHQLRQPIRIEYYVTRVVSQSESSITSPESSRLGWKALLGSRLESARYSLSKYMRVFHPPYHLSSHSYYSLLTFWLEIWHINLLIQQLLCFETFYSKSNKLRISGLISATLEETWFENWHDVKLWFEFWHRVSFCIQIWQIVKFSIRNCTLCKCLKWTPNLF